MSSDWLPEFPLTMTEFLATRGRVLELRESATAVESEVEARWSKVKAWVFNQILAKALQPEAGNEKDATLHEAFTTASALAPDTILADLGPEFLDSLGDPNSEIANFDSTLTTALFAIVTQVLVAVAIDVDLDIPVP